MKYRNDIDGLRGIAVIAVIIFHLGFLPNGYLGVDVFFVISGFLISSIIFKEIDEDRFSILKFYERRIRRIIPLLLFVTSIAFILGLVLMLPDDLENLAQSVVASNTSANNILMLITSSDYWATRNEYKPLLHTWSLGIEEQFYLIYPFLFLMIAKIKKNYIRPILLILSILSVTLFIFGGNAASRFYLLHFRFFELSLGGLGAITYFKIKEINKRFRVLFYPALFSLILVFIIPFGINQLQVILAAILTSVLLVLGKYLYQDDTYSKFFLQSKVLVFIGKISYSLYMWHQVVFAFSRYAFFDEINVMWSMVLVVLTFLLSVLSYYFIENTFRNKNKLSIRSVILSLSIVFIVSTSASFYVYLIGGVYKDFPTIGMYKADNKTRGYNLLSSSDNIHNHYNAVIRKLDKNFDNQNKTKILVVGNSYGRDVANIFLESSVSSDFQLSYFDVDRIAKDPSIKERWLNADYIFVAAEGFLSKQWVAEIGDLYDFEIDFDKVTCFGTKDYGYSNGIHYNKLTTISKSADYYTQMKKGVIDTEAKLKDEWGEKYISLIEPVKNNSNKVRVFTPDGKFISQDTLHLTKFGAKFYAEKLKNRIESILNIPYNS